MSAPESEPTTPAPAAPPSERGQERAARAARGGARRDQARDRRAGRDARTGARVPRRRWPPADRGRPGPREDPHDQDDRRRARRLVQARPVHTRPRPVRPRRHPDLPTRPRGRSTPRLGPVFCNFLLADEINRAPAKVQSALLEVMQERQVTIGHDTHVVPRPVPRDGDPEPDRVRGHLSAPRGAGRPVHAEGRRRLPEA